MSGLEHARGNTADLDSDVDPLEGGGRVPGSWEWDDERHLQLGLDHLEVGGRWYDRIVSIVTRIVEEALNARGAVDPAVGDYATTQEVSTLKDIIRDQRIAMDRMSNEISALRRRLDAIPPRGQVTPVVVQTIVNRPGSIPGNTFTLPARVRPLSEVRGDSWA